MLCIISHRLVTNLSMAQILQAYVFSDAWRIRCWLYDVILIRLLRPRMVGAAERAMKLEGMFGVS